MEGEDFERLYHSHAGRLLSFLVYQTGDRILAEDLVADTFERVIRSRRPFDPRRGRETTWLYGIALNLLRDHARRKAAEGRAIERVTEYAPAGVEGSGLEQVHAHDAIVRALRDLSEDERRALALRYGADLAMKEIATLTGQPRKSVERRIYRGLERLRTELDPDDLFG